MSAMAPSDTSGKTAVAGATDAPDSVFLPDSPSPAVTAPLTDPARAPLNGTDVLAHLGDVVAQRRAEGDPDKSYVARLFAKGLDQILKKVGEEATEVVLAAKDGAPDKLVYEVADLWFHSIVALAAFDLRPEQVLAELARREGLSGLEEFARRSPPPGTA
jgi:phosphoribosyl-ATP pyrophosphohydrolase